MGLTDVQYSALLEQYNRGYIKSPGDMSPEKKKIYEEQLGLVDNSDT
jgi:hypothetical protein